MVCGSHSERQAAALCVSCGVGLCGGCVQKSAKGRSVCSPECANFANVTDEAMAMLSSRTQRGTKATAWFCWLLGGLFAILGLLALVGGDKFLATYLLAPSVIFFFTGTWYGRIAKRASNGGVQPAHASGHG